MFLGFAFHFLKLFVIKWSCLINFDNFLEFYNVYDSAIEPKAVSQQPHRPPNYLQVKMGDGVSRSVYFIFYH